MSTQKSKLSRVLHSVGLWRKPQNQVEEKMSEEEQAIRDFIYLDTPRLESILAQLQRGLVRGLVEIGGREAGIEAELGGGLPWLQARLTGRGGISGERQVSKVSGYRDHTAGYLSSIIAPKMPSIFAANRLFAPQ